MSSQFKLRRGSTISHSGFTGADGEVTFNTDTNQLVTHDGVTSGGHPHLKVSDLATNAGAAMVGFTPVGGLVSTNVQAAIAEVVTDLSSSAGSSLMGYMPAGAGAVVTDVQTTLRAIEAYMLAHP